MGFQVVRSRSRKRPWNASNTTQEQTLVSPKIKTTDKSYENQKSKTVEKIKTSEKSVLTFEKTKTKTKTFEKSDDEPIDKSKSESQVKRPMIFRLNLRKPSEPPAVASPAGTPSGRTYCPPVERPSIVAAPQQPSAETNAKPVEPAARLEPQVSCSTRLEPKAKLQKRKSTSSLYEDLIVNWVPQPFHFSYNDDNDQEWLVEKRQHNQQCGSKTYNAPGNQALGCRSTTMRPPLAQLLPEAGGLHALPFTAPF